METVFSSYYSFIVMALIVSLVGALLTAAVDAAPRDHDRLIPQH